MKDENDEKELAVVMETDSGWVRHGPTGDPWGECHSSPGFTVDSKLATLEPTIPAVPMGSAHMCVHSLRDITI